MGMTPKGGLPGAARIWIIDLHLCCRCRRHFQRRHKLPLEPSDDFIALETADARTGTVKHAGQQPLRAWRLTLVEGGYANDCIRR
jgi:hypothetical protein